MVRRSNVGLLIYLLFAVGAAFYFYMAAITPPTPTRTAQPGVVMVTLDPSLDRYAADWQREVARRFPRAAVILCHGGDFMEGQWILGASYDHQHVTRASEIMERYQAQYPDRTLVLLACNPGHLKLGIPGVYFFPDSVWCIPDRSVGGQGSFEETRKLSDGEAGWYLPEPPGGKPTRSGREPDVCGNIFEAVTD